MLAAKLAIPLFVLVTLYTTDVISSDVYSCSKDDVCSKYGKRYTNENNKCCHPCLCLGNCTFGKCCPHESNFEINRQSKCIHQLEFIKGRTDAKYLRSIHRYLRRFYYVVSKCPTNTSHTLRAACEHTNGIDGSNYVSDAVTYTIYKNEMCARCNGVESYIQWTWAISMSNTQVTKLIENTYDEHSVLGLMEGNYKFSIPPSGYPKDLNVCNDEAVDFCNSSGKWEQYDSKLDKLCGLSTFTTVQVGSKLFKNIYCALCNIPVIELLSETCKNELIFGRFSYWSFNTIISWNDEDIRLQEKTEINNICSNQQIFDPLENVCRNITCPLGMRAKTGLCRQMFVIDDLTVDLSIVLQARQIDLSTWRDLIESSIIPKPRLEKLGCMICQWKFGFLDDTKGKILLVLNLRTSLTCNIETLLAAVRRYEGHLATLKIVETSFQGQKLNLRIVFDYEQSSKKVKQWSSSMTVCRSHYTVPPKYYCPAVIIPYESVRYKLDEIFIENFISLSTPTIFSSGLKPNVTNDSRIICLTDYLRIVSEFSISNRNSTAYFRISTLLYLCYAIMFVLIADNRVT